MMGMEVLKATSATMNEFSTRLRTQALSRKQLRFGCYRSWHQLLSSPAREQMAGDPNGS